MIGAATMNKTHEIPATAATLRFCASHREKCTTWFLLPLVGGSELTVQLQQEATHGRHTLTCGNCTGSSSLVLTGLPASSEKTDRQTGRLSEHLR